MSAEKLRHVEYYDMQPTLDKLFKLSSEGKTRGLNLYDLIISKPNILLAYRMIKSNHGSKTAGVDKQTIDNFKVADTEDFVKDIRNALHSYTPQMVRRVDIPKPNGKTRPLGIPTMRDRIIQQMFKQILEPICEAKFYKHSYGFRPNRSTEHALARCNILAYRCKCHYVVDVDIKGFFDNVNHTKLLKQLFSIGITDKRVLTIISKMLKAPTDREGVKSKGTPQGGILSPLLSNVVLNSLDWWITNQWETFEAKRTYSSVWYLHHILKTTKLKEMHIVRYADDFKIYTNSPKNAIKIFHAVRGYIENELKLEISTEKSRITNLRKRYSEFLGFELKVKPYKKETKTVSRVSKKSVKRLKSEVRNRIKVIQKNPTLENMMNYNSFILGIQNYYCRATLVSKDFAEIYYSCLPTMYNRFIRIGKYERPRSPPLIYKQRYSTTQRTFIISGFHIYPISNVSWKRPNCFNPKITNFSASGRSALVKKRKVSIQTEISKLGRSEIGDTSLEYFDNRISKYSMQRGKCRVTKQFLTSEMVHCHHIVPKKFGGTDSFDNLVIIHQWAHALIHATKEETIKEYLNMLRLSKKELEKLNKLRKNCNLTVIRL